MSDGDGPLTAILAEKELLGSMLLDPDGTQPAFLSVPVEAFCSDKNRRIAEAIRHLLDQGLDISPVTIIEHLRGIENALDRAGSVPYIMGLADTVATAAYADSSAAIVNEKAKRRELDLFARETQALARDGALGLDELFGAVERRLMGAKGEASQVALDDYADEALAVLDPSLGVYWQTGFARTDRLTGGFKGLTIMAARPSMGKSSLMRDILRHNTRVGKVALFTNDQAGADVLAFEASRRAGVPYHEIKTGAAGPTAVRRWRTALLEVRDEFRGTYLIDHRAHNIDALATHIRSAVHWGAQLIAVDYLQNVPVPQTRGDPVRSVTLVSQTLKLLSQDLSTPILALCQLNRSVETRKDRRPIMSDLRESGQIEQDAEAIVFLYRDEYYASRADGRGEDIESTCEFIVAKNKTGPTGTAQLIFDSRFASFRNPDPTGV